MNMGIESESTSADSYGKRARIYFDLATVADDLELRQLLRSIRMEGIISVSFRREPNYFAAHQLEGDFIQVLTARDRDTQQIVGMGSRSIRERYVAGRPRPIGYLSGLRIHPDYRGSTMLSRGYRYLRELDLDRRADFYVTTIAVENEIATKALLQGRAGLPFYKKIGRLNTWIVPKKKRAKASARVQVKSIDPSKNEELMQFLEKVRCEKELLPKYAAKDFIFPSSVFAGMQCGDLYGMWIDNELVGTLGIWDQRSMKQFVVERYKWWLHWLRPLYNTVARITGRVRFPKPGNCLPLVTAALPLAIGKGQHYYSFLVDEVTSRLPNDVDAIMIGLCDSDPLTKMIRQHAMENYQTDIFLVSWKEEILEASWNSGGIPYLELGAL
jgi:hypothetical protein